jgi:hypothetical protein
MPASRSANKIRIHIHLAPCFSILHFGRDSHSSAEIGRMVAIELIEKVVRMHQESFLELPRDAVHSVPLLIAQGTRYYTQLSPSKFHWDTVFVTEAQD